MCAFIAIGVCPSCVIPQSEHIVRVGLLHVCTAKLLLQSDSPTFPSFPSSAASSLNFSSASLSPGRLFSVPPLAAPPPRLYDPLGSPVFPLSLNLFLVLSRPLAVVSFASSLCRPPPSFLIRAICWRERTTRGREREFRGWTGLCCMFLSAVQRWSQACVEMWRARLCLFAVTCRSDGTYGPDSERPLSALAVCSSAPPRRRAFYNPSITPVFLSPSSLHPLNTSLFITSLLPPGGCDYLHILIFVAPSQSSALKCS